jgi:hypothetical protein
MPTTSNFGWTTPADTDLVKDGAAAIRTLGNGIDTSLLDLKGGTSGQVLSKNSNTDLDYTWVTPNVGDITEVQAGTGISVASGTGPIPVVTNTVATAIDAKGDLIVGTGADTFSRLAVGGTNGHTLQVDSSTSTGLKWAAPAGDFVLIASQAPSAVASQSFNSCFSSTYKAYKIVFVLTASAGTNLLWKGRVSTTDTSTNYNYQDFELSNTTFYNASYTGQTSGKCGDLQTYLTCNEMTITDPFASNSTSAVSFSSSLGNNLKMNSSRQTDNTSFDGITFLTGSGTMSGNIYIYGLKA